MNELHQEDGQPEIRCHTAGAEATQAAQKPEHASTSAHRIKVTHAGDGPELIGQQTGLNRYTLRHTGNHCQEQVLYCQSTPKTASVC